MRKCHFIISQQIGKDLSFWLVHRTVARMNYVRGSWTKRKNALQLQFLVSLDAFPFSCAFQFTALESNLHGQFFTHFIKTLLSRGKKRVLTRSSWEISIFLRIWVLNEFHFALLIIPCSVWNQHLVSTTDGEDRNLDKSLNTEVLLKNYMIPPYIAPNLIEINFRKGEQ